jgi:hypothetical protein
MEARPFGTGMSTPPSVTEPFAVGSVSRFIDGEPMKPATNVFVGRS